MHYKMCFISKTSLIVLIGIAICSNQGLGCTSTTVEYKRFGGYVIIQFLARTVNTEDSSLTVTNQILSNNDSPLVSALYINGVNVYISGCNNCTFTGNAATGDLSIRIDNIQASDAGLYKHSVSQASGEVNECVVLYVLGKPTKPIIKMDDVPYEGEIAVLTCSSTSRTTPYNPTLKMMYNWMVNNNDANDQRYTYSGTKNKLTISKIERRDANKQFTCTATENVTNAYTSNSSDQFSIHVYYGPSIRPFNVGPIVDGSTLSVECIFDPGNPNRTTIIWKRKLNSSLENSWQDIPDSSTTGNQLLKQNVTRNDIGIYNCTASNIVRQADGDSKTAGISSQTFLLDILYSPTVTSFYVKGQTGTSTVLLNENDEGIQLFCDVDSNPASSVQILYDNKVVKESTDLNQATFTFSSVSCLNSGEYSCEGRNKIGQSSRRNLHLLVNCKPRPLYRVIQNISSLLHTQVMMSFTALAYPNPGAKGFSWQKENGGSWTQVLANRDIVISSTQVQSNLTILNITKTDFGRYKLDIYNSLGTYVQLFNLAEKIFDKDITGRDTNCENCSLNNSAIITGISLGIFNAVLIGYGVIITILYRRKSCREEVQPDNGTEKQKEYYNVSYKAKTKARETDSPERRQDYSTRSDTGIETVSSEIDKQYMELSDYSRDDKTTYDELKI